MSANGNVLVHVCTRSCSAVYLHAYVIYVDGCVYAAVLAARSRVCVRRGRAEKQENRMGNSNRKMTPVCDAISIPSFQNSRFFKFHAEHGVMKRRLSHRCAE